MTDQWALVALVLVSHSQQLAEGAAQVAAQMAPGVRILPAGGTDDGGLGTSFDRVEAAVREATAGGGSVVVLTDLGSAVLTAESVLEAGDPATADRVRIADAPFVEGAVAAAVTAHGGADVDQVLASAQAAGRTFGPVGTTAAPDTAPEVVPGGATEPVVAPDGSVRATTVLRNPLGLHARPAALMVRMLAAFDAKVQVNGVNAASVLELMKLGAVKDDVLVVTAQGPQAAEAVRRLVADVEAGFGEV
ncbi:PTS-dependent dihydroxyacetone kinase phosphotransferase subunit DhaM [Cellulomonas sp. zg-ZUI199]|uniref:Phosphocarrier protein HPr n=1 Tax=Cellulomonas wangleii TaxID=2816956 RepID=A0ABX8D888_9CELL|nr:MULTISPECIES: dihydroxyacetone kinase phosphoryl donor subunit DhaM [Cellulomonas]MBO0900748.1 PTS-dependent dihydroxyacetone kinase phosphotransferase subunit DhaM [Cellulomonas sp. zg-ZUI22]MBO0925832.1 PTS-dependent dihydroxyacetone kinase phosphotransferase subunit DhaM [Cellulomonas wangleii]QVI63652.1 PTS-dependent dihydroxyacetone kinase phosphotransferase subunit DhaM [Cellulomonas wangleii]